MTSAQIAIAAGIAWVAWPGNDVAENGHDEDFMRDVGDLLISYGFANHLAGEQEAT